MLVSRIGEARSVAWLTAGTGGASVVGFVLLAASPPALIGAVTLFALAQMLTGPLMPTTVSVLAPPSRCAACMAAASVATDIEDSLAPATSTALYALAARLPWILGIPLVAFASLGLGAAIGGSVRLTNLSRLPNPR